MRSRLLKGAPNGPRLSLSPARRIASNGRERCLRPVSPSASISREGLCWPDRRRGARQSSSNRVNGPSREEAADGLREQAASCRRLAQRARTAFGSTALKAVAERFDDDARLIDPKSLRR